MSELHIEDLAKRYGSTEVLHGVGLDVPSGELLAILGASGSGKTTLLRLICGFERADAGRIAVDGQSVCGPGLHVLPERRGIGYVAQEGALFPHLSVARNITFGLSRAARKKGQGIGALLELVGLPATYAARPPHQLSGGEQQRVALARALAPRPGLILLDEPFSALDAALRVETRQAVARALHAAGATALLVTHDQSEALSMGRRVAVLRGGRLVQVDTPQMLYRRPVDAELARFVGEAVLLPGLATGGTVTCRLGRLALASDTPDGPVEVMIRPEQVCLGTGSLHARISEITYYGHDASVTLVLPGEPPATLTARIAGQSMPRAGKEVALHVEGAVMAYHTRIRL